QRAGAVPAPRREPDPTNHSRAFKGAVMSESVGMKSLALSFPAQIRTTACWRESSPALVADEEKRTLARLWKSNAKTKELDAFEHAMAPYLSDPFRGARERRVLSAAPLSVSL